MTREEIEKASWLGDQRQQVLALLDRAETAERAFVASEDLIVAADRLASAVEIMSATPTHPDLWRILIARAEKLRTALTAVSS